MANHRLQIQVLQMIKIMTNGEYLRLCQKHGVAPIYLHGKPQQKGQQKQSTGDWAKDNDRRAAEQRAEQQSMADFYTRQTQQQEDRENAEARERFDESQRKRWGSSKTE
jgi:hypothetical protein